MSDEPQHSVEAPPHVRLVQMASAYWVSKVVYAAAKLGLADHLAAGPRDAAELATLTRAYAPSIHRLMRTLAGVGLLSKDGQERFALTPLGAALRTGAPGSARASVLTLSGPWFVESFEQILHSVQTGKPGFEEARGMPIFDYLTRHPAEAASFVETMVGFHGQEPPAVAAAYDFSAVGTLVDVGSSGGSMLAAVLPRYPELRGVLFDQPHVVAGASAFLQARGIADRVVTRGGDFFEAVPAGGDAYLLSHVIHDWSEQQALTILRNVRRAITPRGRLLIVEMVLPDDDAPHPGKMLDMVMLTVSGGQERTAAEHSALLDRAGFRLVRVVPTRSDASVVEAAPA